MILSVGAYPQHPVTIGSSPELLVRSMVVKFSVVVGWIPMVASKSDLVALVRMATA